jgi:hypothetical protein
MHMERIEASRTTKIVRLIGLNAIWVGMGNKAIGDPAYFDIMKITVMVFTLSIAFPPVALIWYALVTYTSWKLLPPKVKYANTTCPPAYFPAAPR